MIKNPKRKGEEEGEKMTERVEDREKKVAVRWRVLVVCLEYVEPVFSGNGVLARTLVRVLLQNGVDVTVICGAPSMEDLQVKKDKVEARDPLATGSLKVLPVGVSKWFKLDKDSAWREFGLGAIRHATALEDFQPDVVLAVDWSSALVLQTLRQAMLQIPKVFLNFRIFSISTGISEEDRVFYKEKEALAMQLCCDTVALCKNDALVLEALDAEMNEPAMHKRVHVLNPPLRPDMYALCQRQTSVRLKHARQLALYRHALRGSAQDEKKKPRTVLRSRSMDGNSVEFASDVETQGFGLVELSPMSLDNGERNDAGGLRRVRSLGSASDATEGGPIPRAAVGGGSISGGGVSGNGDAMKNVQHGFGGPRPVVLTYLKSQRFGINSLMKRRYLTCCCRVCPEKNVQHFVDVVVELAEFLKHNHIVPCLVGPPTDDAFANKLYKKLDMHFPGSTSKVVPKFLPHNELAVIFSETLLNFHPALYEAYGMTMIEAAAFGAPSIMHSDGGIGAADVLCAPTSAFLCDMSSVRHCAHAVRSILDPRKADILACVGAEASKAAMAWDEKAFGKAVFSLLIHVVQNRFRAFDFDTQPNGNGTHMTHDDALERHVDDERVEFDSREEMEFWQGMHAWVLSSAQTNKPIKVSTVKQMATGVAALSITELAKRVEAEWSMLVEKELSSQEDEEGSLAQRRMNARKTAKQKLDDAKVPEQTNWARYFIDSFPSVSKARYKLVPSRVPEVAFWSCFFRLIRRAVLIHSERDPFIALQSLAEQQVPAFASLAHTLSTALLGEMMSTRSSLSGDPSEGPHEQEQQQQTLLEPKSSSLRALANLLCQTRAVVFITGFPCNLENQVTQQKSDGPAAVALLVRAVRNLGVCKTIRVLVERPCCFGLQASMGFFFGAKVHWKSRGYSEETFYGDEQSDLCLETFSTGSGFSESHLDRLSVLAKELADKDESVHFACVERIGPARNQKYYGDRGEVLPSTLTVPLHVVFDGKSYPKFTSSAVNSCTASLVGMGSPSLRVPVTTCIPLGEETRCQIETDLGVVGSLCTSAAFALSGAICLAAVDRGLLKASQETLDLIMGTEKDVRGCLEACVAAGCWDSTTQQNSKTICGASFESLLVTHREMRSVVSTHWESARPCK